MFFALVANDRARFDGLLRWTELNLASDDLTAHLPGCGARIRRIAGTSSTRTRRRTPMCGWRTRYSKPAGVE
jgi:hypothetical protein